ITQFTAQFLDMKRALTEFNRVTKSGSYIGILEMAKDDEIPPKLKELIEEAEEITRRVTELDFRLLTPEDWKKKFEEAGMYEIQTVKLEKVSAGKYMSLIGKGRFIKLIYRATYHLLFNSKIREKFMAMGKAKRIMRNRKDTTKYLSTIVCVGRK
ncbi:MAG: class I SAM-dependent methyltransferase, partial [Candidatus Hodarchaeota archaeon]